eukprot:52171-Eustigmatos_ZCMA.PRE.1
MPPRPHALCPHASPCTHVRTFGLLEPLGRDIPPGALHLQSQEVRVTYTFMYRPTTGTYTAHTQTCR